MIDQTLRSRLEGIRILSKGKITSAFAGGYSSAFKGRGMEFEEVRPYQLGDEVKFIDWNVTAKSGEPFVKVFRVERELCMMLLLDLSPSGSYSSQEKSKNQLAAELCAMLAFTAYSNQDRVGLIIFTDRIEKTIPPSKGNNHIMTLVREVLTFEPQGRGTSIKGALEYCRILLKRRSILFLISDFHDQGYERALGSCGQRHDLVCLQLIDPKEADPPKKGLYRFKDAETGRTRLFDGRSREGQRQWIALHERRQKELKESLRQRGGELLTLRADEDWIPRLAYFFLHRRSRW